MRGFLGLSHAMITGIRLPVPLSGLGFPAPLQVGGVTVWEGSRAWAWSTDPPDLAIRDAGTPPPGTAHGTWGIDHLVLLVADLDEAAAALEPAAGSARVFREVRGRPTGFWLVGTLLEVVEETSVDRPLLYGVSLETDEQLVEVADRWRAAGFDVAGPREAFQPGRSIITVGGLRAGLAVMSARVGSSR